MKRLQQSTTVGTLEQLQKGCATVSYATCDPFAVIWIGVVKMHDIYKFIEPSKNNQWRNYVSPDTELVNTIHCVGSRIDCQVEAGKLIIQHRPVCNLTGHSHSKRISCSNGMTYANQAEAALATGCSQGAVSAVVNGRLKAIKGLVFAYTA
jgi:hypothetical protein